ncbi:MAG: DUF3179 domain-containing protein [Gammaproteobacteria bacterium]
MRTIGLLSGLLTILFWSLPVGALGLPLAESRLVPERHDQYIRAMQSGGPGKDGIPSIDQPEFWNAQEAADYLDDADIVFGVYKNGEARAYPQRILVWHEIVNDTIGATPISVTYCPLTATAIGFDRGKTTLGVSGRLINSNMVMYDRASDSLWPQILAAAIRGPLEGEVLSEFRVFWTTWGQWRARHPETRVMSTRTGYARNYQRDPYGQYNPLADYYLPDSGRMFPVMNSSRRYADKTTILGFRTADIAVAVDRDYLRSAGVIQHTYMNQYYTIIHDPVLDTGWVYRSDNPVMVDIDSVVFAADGPQAQGLAELESINAFEAMWFAWYSYYPETVVLDGSD